MHGRPTDTPAAVIQEGTTRNQFVVVGMLGDIVEKAQGVRPPAVLVVGEVVCLHEQINWFDKTSRRFEELNKVFQGNLRDGIGHQFVTREEVLS
jgi:precorrin-4 methylase